MKALVEATPISGPASVGRRRVGQPRNAGIRHVDDADRPRSPVLHVAQRRQRVRRLARLRHDDGEPAVVDGRLAIAVFRGDVDLDRQPRQPLDPILADEPGHIGGAAGDDRHARQPLRVGRPGERLEPERRHVDVMGERVADHLRLLVDLLGHEVPVIALLRQQAAGRAALDAALDPACRSPRECRRPRGSAPPSRLLRDKRCGR